MFDLLGGDEGPDADPLGQRYRVNLAKLFSGDIYYVAEVVRDLSLRERGRGLSSAEKRILAKAREILISERAFVVGSTEENAEAMLDEVLGDPGRSIVSPSILAVSRLLREEDLAEARSRLTRLVQLWRIRLPSSPEKISTGPR